LPEVSLVAILDADKEGYLRSWSSLIQTIGRAARHSDGHVIMYADNNTDSMKKAIGETYRRRDIQEAYNKEHDITPEGIHKAVKDITDRVKAVAERRPVYDVHRDMPKDDLLRVIKHLESQMKLASRALEFEKAALLRDEVVELRKVMASGKETELDSKLVSKKL
jgi:excinuclease ABC subunit B